MAMLMLMLMVMSVTVAVAFASGTAAKDTQPKVPVIIGFKDTPSQADKDMIRGHGGDIKHSYTIINAIAAKLPEQAINKVEKNPRVAYVEMDGEVHALDTELENSWGVKRIGAGTVHADNKGTGVKVAIIDTGIDYNHPDLDANYKEGGRDYVNDDFDPMDDNGHGTHCAGIIAAEDNGEGVVGVAPEAYLYAVKVLDNTGSGYLSDVIAGIQWSVNNGMGVISMSLGSDSGSTALKNACDSTYGSGVLLVAAAGNDGNPPGKGDNVDYPARYSSVIAVAATDRNDNRASWSSTGPEVELAAPGIIIYSTWLDGEYATKSGTSMACPHVSGTAALVIAFDSSLSNADVRLRLQETADDLGAIGFDTKYGFGLVDADEAAPPPEETFTKSLPEGGNLISLPLTPSDNSTASVFAGISHDAVYRYNATAETEQFENASTMEPGTGYFVNVTAPGQIWTYNGTPYTTMNVSLEQGLNTVGWLNCSKSISDALSSLGGKYNYVARFNATSQSFEAYNPHALSDDFNEFTTMSRGTGYFISMKEDSTLNESC